MNASANTQTTNEMNVGDVFAGAVQTGGDSDWIKVTLEAGKTYKIDALGLESSGGGSLFDTDLNLYDSSGSLIENDDLDGAGFDASITYTATTSGTFYIAVDSFSSTQTGSYILEVDEYVPLPASGSTGTYEELAEFLKSGTNNGVEFKYNTTSSNVITVNISGLEADGQQLALWAMEAWEMVIDVDFQVVTSGEMITVDDENSGAFAYYPNAGSTSTGVELNVSKAWLDFYGTSIDSYSFQTYVHEFGHALGLNHLGNYNFDPNGPQITYQNSAYFTNDSWQVSVMSYFDQNENTSTNATKASLATTMIADIIAAQHFYGAADGNSATAGDTIFGHGSNLGNYMDEVFSSMVSGTSTANTTGDIMAYTLFDQGGTDLFDLSPYTQNLKIDLNDGAFSDVGSFISVIAIAVDTIIENLKLGSGNDTAIGNEADNTIEGGGGNDTITGNAGNDVIDGGTGTDTGKFAGLSTVFNILTYGGYVGIHDTTGAEGLDLFENVENFEFSDTTISSGSITAFDALAYIASNADLIPIFGANGLLGLSHYLTNGITEGRTVSFSGLEYLASYADLRAVFGNNIDAATQHFIEYGFAEGRKVTFSGLEYIASYADLIAAFGTNADAATEHYIVFGANEGREATFSGLEYIASYADLTVAFGTDAGAATLHYIQYGAGEGREVTFSGLEYLASYADLRAVFGTDAEAATKHFLEYGLYEGRSVSFDGYAYLASHLDLLTVFGADAEAATLHYIEYGANEGRGWDARVGLDEITTGQTGDSGDNTLNGGTEAELLVGMGGADTINGGAGDDVLVGGGKSDTFVFNDGFGNDVIADFNAQDDNEKIDLSDVGEISDFNDLVNNHLSTVNGVVTITDGANTIALNGVDINDLGVDDFIFV
ncbi:MAG: M10 family metallopeptidase C-terminal domain-containing protein [Pseudomonadota bacterium]